MKLISKILMVSTLGSLVACGGSSSGSGESAPQASAPLLLTTSNAGQSANVAADATSDASASSAIDTAFGASVSDAETFRLIDSISDTLALVKRADQFYPDTVTGLVIPVTVVPCDISGTLTVSGNVNNNFDTLGFAAGDQFDTTLSNCSDVPGEVLNGSISMTFLQVAGDFYTVPFYSYEARLNVNDYSVVSGTESIYMDGDALFYLEVGPTGDEVRLSGNRLTLSVDTIVGLSLFDYDFQESTVVASGAYRSVLNGVLDSNELGGSIEIVTIVPLEGIGTGDPESGQFRVIGSGNSTVLVTALGSGSVRLETDSDGDGIVDVDGVEITTWDNLDLL